MVAVLILHGRSDLDWATALANELADHAPVRFQLTSTPPKVSLGPSVVRIGLWSDDGMAEGISHTLSAVLAAEPTHSVIVRRGGAAPPPDLAGVALAGDIEVAGAREAAARLREALPGVTSAVVQIVASKRRQAETAKSRREQAWDRALLIATLAALAAAAWHFDWFGLRG